MNIFQKRRKILVKFAKDLGYDTLVSFEPTNIFYITGFWGHSICILDNTLKTTLITTSLETNRAQTDSKNCDIIKSNNNDLINCLIKKTQKNTICTDCENFIIMQKLTKSLKITHSLEPFYNSRSIKDNHEITIIKKASSIIDDMFTLCTNKIKTNQKESELQSILMSYAMEHHMFDTGYKFTTMPLIIASGPNSSFPHAQVTNRKFCEGDFIVVDITLRYNGYISDATRTFGLGKISKNAQNVYDIVKNSQQLGIIHSKIGILCSAIDNICRNYIAEHNYDKYFIHSTGHGVGLDVHEPPYLSANTSTKLKQNMIITVEPGIYIQKKFGVRIEDSIFIGTKPTSLHKFTKELMIL